MLKSQNDNNNKLTLFDSLMFYSVPLLFTSALIEILLLLRVAVCFHIEDKGIFVLLVYAAAEMSLGRKSDGV